MFLERMTKRISASLASVLLLAIAIQAARSAPRTPEQKQVDQAIVKALEYLSKQQQPSGAWRGESTGTTSLAIMAFMAAGHVPGEGPYGEQLERGIRWVIAQQQPNDMLVHATNKSHGPMYSHGISTLMLAEVVGMVDQSMAKQCRRALERAVKLILEAQDVPKKRQHAGGWRYQAQSSDSDLSVTGWQLLALRAAKNVGCDVAADNINQAVAYVKLCSVSGNRGFAYQPGGAPTPTRTGTGILCLEICGKHRTAEALGGADSLLLRPLQYNQSFFFYGVYYCNVGMFKIGGDYWTESKKHVNSILLSNQQPDGSWSANTGNEKSYGPVYPTSMAVLALSVEYRYLPIYQR